MVTCMKKPVNSEYVLEVLSPTAYKIFSLLVIQMRKSKVEAEWVQLSYNQIKMKTRLSYGTISTCVGQLREHPEIVEVNRVNGTTTLFKLNKTLIS